MQQVMILEEIGRSWESEDNVLQEVHRASTCGCLEDKEKREEGGEETQR